MIIMATTDKGISVTRQFYTSLKLAFFFPFFRSFIHSFFSFILSFVPSFVLSFILSFVRSFLRSFFHSFHLLCVDRNRLDISATSRLCGYFLLLLPLMFSGPDGLVKAHEVLHQDVTTGLIVPNPDAVMLLDNQSLKTESAGYFLHPDTGKVLPIAGNVGYDPVTSKLVPVVDVASGKCHNLWVCQ